jgi:prophage regulatory protein
MHADRILRMKQLPEIAGIGRTLIYELVRKGDFPKAVRLGERARGYRESEILAWVESRRAA